MTEQYPISIVLASSSPYRRQQLNQWQIPFQSVAPLINEEEIKKQSLISSQMSPQDLCLHLSRLKAESIHSQYPNSFIIGSDQMAVYENQILNKPGSYKQAQMQLQTLEGQTHYLLTGLHVVYQNKQISFLEEISITLKPLSTQEINSYLTQDQPWDCAGSYKFEKAGVALMKSIKGRDPSAIMGLPMMALADAFEQLIGNKFFSLHSSKSTS